jgi:predicted porin
MKKDIVKLGFLSTVIICSIALIFPPAHAVSFKISGQINRAIEYVDNGVDSEWFHVDNDASSTRFRIVGSEEIGNGITAGIVWETEFESNTSRAIDVGQNSDGSSDFKERKLEAWFSHDWGKITIGQGDGAANGTTEIDLSGTALVTYSDVGTTAAGITFVESNGDPVATVGSVHANFDGLSRNDRLRYDSPKLGPVTLSASATNGDAWELAARLSTEMEGLGKIAAAIGYVDSQDRTTPQYDQIGASISWLHDTGVNLTLAYGSRDTDGGREAENYYAKLGYKRGKHAVSVELGQTDDLAAEGDEASSYGAGYVYNIYKGIETVCWLSPL